MRINRFVALASGISRRQADVAISQQRVMINGAVAQAGQDVADGDRISLDGQPVQLPELTTTILLNKPAGYVVSRQGQGSRTVYELLPAELHRLKPVGRLDKDSSGLLLLTDNGQLAQQLTHPRYAKTKLYEIVLDKPLEPLHQQLISDHGIMLADGRSRLQLAKLGSTREWQVTMREGRNRQIRRTLAALGYDVQRLHRTQFGSYQLHDIKSGHWQKVPENEILTNR